MMEVVGTVSKLQDVYLTLKGVVIVCAAVKCMLIFKGQQDNDQPISVAFEKCKRVLAASAIGILSTDFIQIFQKYWGRTSGNGTRFVEHLVGGFNLFMNDIKGTLILLDAAFTVFYIAKNIMTAMGAGEDRATHLKKAGKNLAVGIAILGAYGLILAIFNYFV